MNTNKVQLMRRDSKTHHVALAASSGRFSDFRSKREKEIYFMETLACLHKRAKGGGERKICL